MNILVCIKQVPDDSVEIHLNAEGTPDLANVTPVVNAFDTYALEMAARLKESSEGEVTVVCVGEDSAKNSLKNCLAVGADHAFLVSDDAFKGSDTTGIANILKNVIAKLEADNGQKFDLVFCGKEATDAALGQGGLMLAEELGTSVITNITEIALDGDKVTAKQETEEGYRTVEASAPCVVTQNQNMTHVTQRSRIKWQQERNQSAILKKLILLILKKKKSENLMQRFRLLNYMNQRRKKPESRFRKKHQKIQQ
mgnify:CR=1 FL=1